MKSIRQKQAGTGDGKKTSPGCPAKRKYRFHSGWIGPRIKALVATTIIFSALFILACSLVVVSVIQKEEKCFSPPGPIDRPKMKLQKLQVPVSASKDKSKPKLRKRIVAATDPLGESADIAMPEVAGMRGGSDYGEASESVGFYMPEVEVFSAEKISPSSGTRPKMSLRKPKVLVKKSAKPQSTTRIVTKVRKADMPDLQLPELGGMGSGLGGAGDGLAGSGLGLDYAGFDLAAAIEEEPISLFGGAVTIEENPAEEKEERIDDLFGDPAPEYEADADDLFGDIAAPPKQPELPSFNPYVLAAENAFSTFSIDVDTAAYGLARQSLLDHKLPEPESVRTEEFINSFDYDYRPPAGSQTFSVHKEMAPAPFRTGMDLLKIGIKGRRIGRDDHRSAMLTLVIDTSGSMSTPERLGLVKQSVAMLLDELDPTDEVAIVQFGGKARLVMEHTPAAQKDLLMKAVNELQPGGPTQFDMGLQLGFQLARDGFSAGDSNRIIIMSDGVANLGELDPEMILNQVGENRQKGIYLSVLGFGAGTYDDDLLERLANRGDGMYAYIDSLEEARRVFVDQLASTLHVIASDVKIQVEFNPERVISYRQIGYENRQLTKEQFRDDSVDAGEVGSGQSVTALYDIQLNPEGPEHAPIATVYVRYRRADNGAIEEISSVVRDSSRWKRYEQAAPRFQLAACVAEFAERLRRSPYSDGIPVHEIHQTFTPVTFSMDLDQQVQELAKLMVIAARLQD